MDSWYFLPLLALLPIIYRRTKEKIASAPVTTISLARYRLLAQIMQQRKVASGPAKPPLLIFIAAALAIVAASQPTPSIPAPGHGIAVVVGVEASNSMGFPGGEELGGQPRLQLARDAARSLFKALGPGDPTSLIIHDSRIAFSAPLGLTSTVSLETLDSLASGFGGNKPGAAIAHATRLLAAAPPTSRRVAVFFNDGAALDEDLVSALNPVKDLPPVEGYIVFVSSDAGDRAKMQAATNSIGWTLVSLKEWDPARVASGPSTVSGESLLPLTGFLALGAFGLLALAVFREIRKA